MTSTTHAPVPFLDLSLSHAPLKEQLLEQFAALIDDNAFTNGPAVAAFEASFASWCGTSECVGVASGLDGLRLALLSLGLQPGDEVIVPANTFIATFEAVSQAGGVPVPVDVDPADLNLDSALAAAAITERTRGLMPVHLYGQMADMVALGELARRTGVWIVEDACQAHGADRSGLRAGACSQAAAFSFYPGKNLGAFGDAGAVTTSDAELAASMRSLREHGQRQKYEHLSIGYTSRLDTIQAIVLQLKLSRLDAWNNERRAIADAYEELLGGVGDLSMPRVAPESRPVWHLYVVRTPRRDELAAFLRERGIGTGLHYPEPPHLSRAYKSLGYGAGAFPVSEQAAKDVLSLPIFPGMSYEQVVTVADGVRAFFDR